MQKVFISYSRADNDEINLELDAAQDFKDGAWVTRFTERLKKSYKTKDRNGIEIYRDTEIVRGNHDFRPQLRKALGDSAALVVILSEAWLTSEECQWELKTFRETHVDDLDGRIFIATISNCDNKLDNVLRSRFSGLSDYPFWENIPDTNISRTIDPQDGEHSRFTFRNSMGILAKHLSEFFMEIEAGYSAAFGHLDESDNARPAVFIAHEPDITHEKAEALQNKLKAIGIRVIGLPSYTDRSDDEIKEELSKVFPTVDATIHLIGNRPRVEGKKRIADLEVLQLSLARESGPSSRIIWREDASIEVADSDASEAGQNFAESVQSDERVIDNQYWEEAVEDILDAVKQPIRRAQTISGKVQSRATYIIYGKLDAEAVNPICQRLGQSEMNFVPSLLDGDPESLVFEHINRLQSANSVVVYWGSATDAWFEQKLDDIEKYCSPDVKIRIGCIGDPREPQKGIMTVSLRARRPDLDMVEIYAAGAGPESVDASPLISKLQQVTA